MALVECTFHIFSVVFFNAYEPNSLNFKQFSSQEIMFFSYEK